jgi:glyoxylate reductase
MGHEVVQRDDDIPLGHEELVGAVGEDGIDGLVCLLTDRIDEEVLRVGAAARLKAVGNVAVGYDNVDIEAANRLGVAVCNTPGVLDESVADLAFMLVLAAARMTSAAEAELRTGVWQGWKVTDYLGRDIHGASLGLVGYGRIARAVARRASGFSMQVTHHARTDTGEPGYVPQLETMLRESEFISLHVPLTETTYHLIGERELTLMRSDAVLVNTSRGPVVDEEALAAALEEQAIFAAGLDVYEREPSISPRLLRAPRTVLLPHIGSATRATRTEMARLACEGVCEVLAGGEPANLVRRGIVA